MVEGMHVFPNCVPRRRESYTVITTTSAQLLLYKSVPLLLAASVLVDLREFEKPSVALSYANVQPETLRVVVVRELAGEHLSCERCCSSTSFVCLPEDVLDCVA